MHARPGRCHSVCHLVAGRAWVVGAAVLVASMAAAMPVAAQEDADGGFSDVLEGVHTPAIKALDALGVLEGTECAEGLFCPDDEMQRSTMAVWLVRALDEAEPAAVSESRFADVDTEAWWLAHVERLAELEVTRGCLVDPLRFCPDRPVPRAQAATFLARALGLPKIPPTTVFAAVSTGWEHACGLGADGTIVCWGDDSQLQCAVPGGTYTAVRSGVWHTCGLRTDGTVACWGSDLDSYGNYRGQTQALTGIFTAIDSHLYRVCGLRPDGTIECWGSGAHE